MSLNLSRNAVAMERLPLGQDEKAEPKFTATCNIESSCTRAVDWGNSQIPAMKSNRTDRQRGCEAAASKAVRRRSLRLPACPSLEGMASLALGFAEY